MVLLGASGGEAAVAGAVGSGLVVVWTSGEGELAAVLVSVFGVLGDDSDGVCFSSVVPCEFQLCKSVEDQLCPSQSSSTFLSGIQMRSPGRSSGRVFAEWRLSKSLFYLPFREASFSLNCLRYGQEGFRLLGAVGILVQIFLPISSSAGLRLFSRSVARLAISAL